MHAGVVGVAGGVLSQCLEDYIADVYRSKDSPLITQCKSPV